MKKQKQKNQIPKAVPKRKVLAYDIKTNYNSTPTSCFYYNKVSKCCDNIHCKVRYCYTIVGCGYYKAIRKRQSKRNIDIEYDDTYIHKPLQASVHENSVVYKQSIDIPCHIEYLKSNDERRHKNRCRHYRKDIKICSLYMGKCHGSAHCKRYVE